MNVLGLGFLTRYRVTLDFPHNRLYLRPGKSVARFENPDMTGLHIIRDEGKTLVHSVDPNSPADQAHICAGDEIVEVNHMTAQSHKLDTIRRIFASAPGDRVHLQTRRDNQIQNCELTLRLFSMAVGKKP
ncbi:MAG: PDZ domain-containing protein [Phycisphaerae bacterium]|nr:PDZ domain-containing protein [Phycisphaerae bacterium]